MKTGWQTKKLGELCRIRTGKKDVNEGNPDGEFPFFTCAAEHTFSDSYSFDTQALLIAGNGDVGKVSYYNGKFEAYQRTYVLSDFKEVSPRFLYLILDGKLKETVSKQKLGNTMPYIKIGMLAEFQLPVPPLPEQHRIVAILDAAFDQIATARANCEANLLNARAIFESHLQTVFTQRGDGWERTTLGKATGGIFTGPFGSLLHKSDYVPNGIPLVNPAHITGVGIEPDLLKTVSKETAVRLKSYIMRKGDIVIGRRGEMGRCALVTEVENGWVCGTGSFYIKPSSRCETRYLVRFLRSEACKAKLESISGGTVMPNLSNTALSNLPIDLPSPAKQAAIVDGIDELHLETQRLESLYQRKLQALDDLKKSLLHQAFSGLL